MKITQLAKRLAKAYIERAEAQADLEQVKKALWHREFMLTPPAGWEGKNAEQREFTKNLALDGDEVYTGLAGKEQQATEAITLLNGAIEGMEAQRRGFEWETRANLVTVLAGAAVDRNGGAVEEQAFDDVVDDVALDDIEAELLEELESQDFNAEHGGKPVNFSEFHTETPSVTYKMLAPEEQSAEEPPSKNEEIPF